MADEKTPPGSDRQWWLTGGPETCFLCEAPVHPEMLTYCIACDRGMCSLCLYGIPEGGQGLCSECASETKENT